MDLCENGPRPACLLEDVCGTAGLAGHRARTVFVLRWIAQPVATRQTAITIIFASRSGLGNQTSCPSSSVLIIGCVFRLAQ